jgi:hypothetical protein
MFIKTEDRVLSQHIKCKTAPLEGEELEQIVKAASLYTESRKAIPVTEENTKLMLAVAAKRTRLHFFERHFCITHQKMVDKRHIDDCELLRVNLSPTHYNATLEQTPIHMIKAEEKRELVEHYDKLQARLKILEQNQVFLVVDKRMAP